MESQSQEEFVKRLEALPKHARDIHEWKGGRCDFPPLRVCTCKECGDKEQIECKGKPYKTKIKLHCEFHALFYERYNEAMAKNKWTDQQLEASMEENHSFPLQRMTSSYNNSILH